MLTFIDNFKWRERLGIEPRNPITITAFTGQRDHIVTKLISINKVFIIYPIPTFLQRGGNIKTKKNGVWLIIRIKKLKQSCLIVY